MANLVEVTLDAGQVVKVNGIPLVLREKTKVGVNSNNVALLNIPQGESQLFTDAQIEQIERIAEKVVAKMVYRTLTKFQGE